MLADLRQLAPFKNPVRRFRSLTNLMLGTFAISGGLLSAASGGPAAGVAIGCSR
jgi:hypothetical protein